MSTSAGAAPGRPEHAGTATDPGRVDVVESLYRGADGADRRPSALRPFRPALRPPEGSQDYSWLYRPTEPSPVPAGLLLPVEAAPPVAAPPVAVLPDPTTGPTTRWSRAEPVPVRRWPALVLLGLALVCAALLALLGAAG